MANNGLYCFVSPTEGMALAAGAEKQKGKWPRKNGGIKV
jgi:hypothetical protein